MFRSKTILCLQNNTEEIREDLQTAGDATTKKCQNIQTERKLLIRQLKDI